MNFHINTYRIYFEMIKRPWIGLLGLLLCMCLSQQPVTAKEMEEFDCIVIGGGIIGSASFYFISKEFGNKSLLLEQYDLLHRVGSSVGESRLIRKTYTQEHYSSLMNASYNYWDSLQDESGSKVITTTGGLDLGSIDNPKLDAILTSAALNHHKIESLTPDEVRARWPTINLPDNYRALFSPEAGVINPTKALAMFHNLARKNGGRILDRARVKKITDTQTSDHPIRVTLEDGREFLAKKIIITAGPWTNLLLDRSDLPQHPPLPLRAKQGTCAYWRPQITSEFTASNFPVFIHYEEPFVYGTPGLEYPSLLKCCGHGGPFLEDPDLRDFAPGPSIDERARPFLEKFFLRVETTQPALTESCLMTDTPDEDYILDKLGEGVVIGAGFSGHGFKLAPLVGRILADLAITGKNPYPQYEKFFSLKRFDKKE